MAGAIETLPPVSAVIFQVSAFNCVQWMYSLSGPSSPAFFICSNSPEMKWETIGAPTEWASFHWSAFTPACRARVSNWSLEEKYCFRSRVMSCGYWFEGPMPAEKANTALRPDSFRPAMQASVCAGESDTCDVSTVVVTPALIWLSDATSSEM